MRAVGGVKGVEDRGGMRRMKGGERGEGDLRAIRAAGRGMKRVREIINGTEYDRCQNHHRNSDRV